LTTIWVIDKFRSLLFHENLLLIVLSMLKDCELSEWEIWRLLHSRYGTTPTAREFQKIIDIITDGAYAKCRWEGSIRKLQLSEAGLVLQRRLEEEYRAIISIIDDYSFTSSVRRPPEAIPEQ
jgi:hypothetical protein